MSIKKKLYFALGMVFVVMFTVVASSLYSYIGSQQLKLNVRNFQKAKSTLIQAKELQLQVSKVWQFITDASLTKDRKVIDEEAKPLYDKALAIVTELQSQNSKETAADLSKLKASLPSMWQTGIRMFNAYQTDWNKGNIVMDEFDKVCDGTIMGVESIVSAAERNTAELEKEMTGQLDQQQKNSINSSILILGVAFTLCILMFALVRSIGGCLSKLTSAIVDVAQGEGDLSKRLDAGSNDEIGQISRMFNLFIDKLHSLISQISSTSTQIAAASTQLHSTAEHIATGAEEIAAQAGMVATAGEEMSATSGDIAQNCQMAAEGAERASQAARNGAVVVDNTVAVMGQIAEKVMVSARTVESLGARSDQIGDIISTIEDIADQTNLLALNAAIEAARAGEQGRGFAVVADEVRALAERTTRATKEISEMIKAIQKETKGAVTAMEQGVQQVETGTVEAARSGEALRDILTQINDVAMQVNQIATAAEEQTATTGEISSNLMQITDVVQQTSHGAQESATAAAKLKGNAEELQRLVRQFKL